MGYYLDSSVGRLPSWALVLGGESGGATVMLTLAAACDSAVLDRRIRFAGPTSIKTHANLLHLVLRVKVPLQNVLMALELPGA
jgi:hypothetical protein